jgi:hypothetical protein
MSEARPIWICAAGDYEAAVEARPPSLKGAVQAALGTPVRRVGRFIQLALIGAGRCVGDATPPRDTAVYMSSARGDLETTLDVVDTLFRAGMPPMPLSFVNTVSNAPCYYVARHFELEGRSNFICSRSFAPEAILDLAMLDLEVGHADSMLVGCVDVATAPLADHRERLELAVDASVGEGSHWLWLRAGQAPDDARAQLVAARTFADVDALVAWLREQALPLDECRIHGGQFLDAAELTLIQQRSGIAQRFEPPPAPGFYDSQSGGVLSAFMEATDGHWLLHVNGEREGPRRAVTLIRRAD